MRFALLVMLLCNAASAERIAKKQPRPSCKPKGAVWFQLDVSQVGARTTFKIFANGGTEMTHRTDRKTTVNRDLCLPPSQMEHVEQLLKESPWKATTPEIAVRCEGKAYGITIVWVFGKRVFTESGCEPDTLDAKSAEALGLLRDKLPQIPRVTPEVSAECAANPLAKGCD